MTVRDNCLACMRGQKTSRVPLFLEGFEHAKLEDALADGDEARRRLARRIVPHNIGFVMWPSYDNRYMQVPDNLIRPIDRREDTEGVTTTREIQTPHGPLTDILRRDKTTNTTWCLKYPVESLADLDKLASVPWQLPSKLTAPEPVAADKLQPRCVYRTGISSPFVCVAGAMSYEMFLEVCATDLDLLRQLTQEMLRRNLAMLDVVLSNRRIEYVWMGGCEWLTPPMGSPRLYEALVQGPETELVQRCHQAGALVHMHCHGNIASTLERIIERGADMTEPVEPPPDGDITMVEAKQQAAGRITLAGNLEARVLEFGSAAEVDAAIRAAFEGGKDRFMLRASAGPIGSVTPTMERNYNRLADLWEELA